MKPKILMPIGDATEALDTFYAYYRLPENYLLQGYWGINALGIHQLDKYLAQCQA